MCRAVRLVVCAPTAQRRMQLRRAAAGIEWQVVAAVGTPDDAVRKAQALHAAALVIDADTPGADHVAAGDDGVRFLVAVGKIAGADATVPADRLDLLAPTLARVLHDVGHHRH